MGHRSRILGGAGAIAALALLFGFDRLANVECAIPSAQAEGERPVAGATEKAVLIVDGMHCATCPVTVRLTLERLDGVKSARVSARESKAYVEYDPAKVSPERMAQAVTDAGYPSRIAGSS